MNEKNINLMDDNSATNDCLTTDLKKTTYMVILDRIKYELKEQKHDIIMNKSENTSFYSVCNVQW